MAPAQAITTGSVADACRQLHIGDRILSANKVQLLTSTYADAVAALTNTADIELVVSTDESPLPVPTELLDINVGYMVPGAPENAEPATAPAPTPTPEVAPELSVVVTPAPVTTAVEPERLAVVGTAAPITTAAEPEAPAVVAAPASATETTAFTAAAAAAAAAASTSGLGERVTLHINRPAGARFGCTLGCLHNDETLVCVDEVEIADGCAAKAGIQQEDVIAEVNGADMLPLKHDVRHPNPTLTPTPTPTPTRR